MKFEPGDLILDSHNRFNFLFLKKISEVEIILFFFANLNQSSFEYISLKNDTLITDIFRDEF